MSAMKVQLWIRHQDQTGVVKFYRTISGPEVAAIVNLVMQRDGTRPWEQKG